MSAATAWSPSLVLLDDVSPADWVVAGLTPWGPDGMRVQSVVPAGFAAHARVLHPATDLSGRRWRWSEISTATGVPVGADTRYNALAGIDALGPGAPPAPWGTPADGYLETVETAVLAGVLGRCTTTVDTAFFAVWEGYGDDVVQQWWTRPARVAAEHRRYHLLRGPVSAASHQVGASAWVGASLWWPADRAWCVATEIDGYDTFVGGSAEAIDAVLSSPGLEAIATTPDAVLDPSPHPPRRP